MFKLRSLKIGQQIFGGFMLILFFFLFNAVLSIITLNQSASIIKEASEVVNPSLEQINNFTLLVTQSKLHIISWVYVRDSNQDKEALKKLHIQYPEFKDRLVRLMSYWKNKQQVTLMDSVLVTFEKLLKIQKKIMSELVDFEDYEDPGIKLVAETDIADKIIPISNKVLAKLDSISTQKTIETQVAQDKLLNSFNVLRTVTIGLGSVLLVFGLIVSFIITNHIVKPIKYLNSIFIKLSQGELPEEKHIKFRDDEIGEMAASADKLVNALRETSRFAENIGKGNYNAQYKPLSEKDVLGNALIEMRNNLAKVSEEERRRGWANEGFAKFSDLIRKNNHDIQQLGDSLISNLVKYVDANQGGLFIVEETQESEEPYMTLISCYAWDKKKFLEQKIYKGDGLAGQAWQEKNTIFLREVPDNYVKITSGLGEANPNCLLIVPLKLNEQVFGVIELASFKIFEPYQIEFVERVAESIASAISAVRISETTRRLLEESKLMTEQMKSQEEEMLQNMEELQATQESLERSQREAKEKEYLFNMTNLVIETTKKFRITNVNELTEAKLRYESSDFHNMSIEYIFDSYEKVEEAKSTLARGYKWSDYVFLKGRANHKIFTKASAAAIRNEQGAIVKYLFLFDDISDVPIQIVDAH
ncbi:MAG: GAF domain-containing protein [Microscillaceae bacterium]|nr:GAF domain-containing protein [Microscillaceae bacterium]MDW8460725.1 GAF domain-containing protein [Cytophagales bacterium]